MRVVALLALVLALAGCSQVHLSSGPNVTPQSEVAATRAVAERIDPRLAWSKCGTACVVGQDGSFTAEIQPALLVMQATGHAPDLVRVVARYGGKDAVAWLAFEASSPELSSDWESFAGVEMGIVVYRDKVVVEVET